MRAWLIAVVLVVGCKKQGAPSSTPDHPTPKPASTTVQDELWKLAPEGAKLGIVISDRGLATAERAWNQIRRVMTATPDLADAGAKLDAAITEVLGTPTLSLATLGMSASKGAAVFLWTTDDADDRMLAIFPVIDRDKFVAAVNGTRGKDTDYLGSATCRMVQGHYACAEPAYLLDKIGKAPKSDLVELAGARGELEMVGHYSEGGHPFTMGVVAQLGRGAITLRAGFRGLPSELAARIQGTGESPLDANRAAGFVIAHIAPALSGLPFPSRPIMPGLTAADLLSNVDGPITFTVPPGTMAIDGRIPMKDVTPARKLVEGCASIPTLAAAGAKVTNGVCNIPLPEVLPDIDLWIEGNGLRVGKKGAPAPATQPATPIASELASGDWVFAIYGRGTLLGVGADVPPILVGEMSEKSRLAARVMMMVNEIGFGIGVDGNTLRMLVSIRTALSNPDEVVDKLVKISPEQIVSGEASAMAKQIAAASPKSPFATDLEAGVGGIMVPTAALGVVAAIAIPAYMDYEKSSRRTEASLQLERLATNAKRYHAAYGTFPKGKVGATPAQPCCKYPGAKCADAEAWNNPVWRQLDMHIDEPHLYRYAYESDGKTFEAKAIADLDCDGIEAAYVLRGAADANGHVTTAVVPPQPGID